MVQPERELEIEWKQFSLALKNDALNGNDKTSSADAHLAAHRVQRVLLAASENGASKAGASLIDLYTAFGIAYHIGGEEFDDELIKSVLAQKNLPADLLAAADDASLDASLQTGIDQAVAVAGEDIGVPTIIFELPGGKKSGFFGPVLQTLPDKPEALKLWDGLSQLASDPNFYELKRTRPTGGPDVFSTAKC